MSSCLVFTLYTISILIGSLSAVHICRYNISALPICTSSTRTGSTIFIDTSMVPQFEEVSCRCSVVIDEATNGPTSVQVGYEPVPGTTSQCGLRFQTGSRILTCGTIPAFPITEEDISQIQFSKTSASANACFILFIDNESRDEERRNATVRCFDKDGPPHTSQRTSLTTITPVKDSPRTSEASSSSVPVTSVTSNSSSSSVSVAHPSPLTLNTTVTETTSSVTDTQTNGGVTYSNSTTVIIAAVVGAVGACVIIVVIVVVYCCCRRRKTKTTKANTSHIHGYMNTSHDAEVTENVVYNMEFPAVKDNANIQLNALNMAYDNAGNDTYNTIDYPSNDKETKTMSSFIPAISESDVDTYNTVDDVALASNKGNTNLSVLPHQAVDTSYQTLEDVVEKTAVDNEAENVQKNNDPSEKQFENSDVTYSVVDKSRSSEKLKERQQTKHFEVSESGDTYAIVDKSSFK